MMIFALAIVRHAVLGGSVPHAPARMLIEPPVQPMLRRLGESMRTLGASSNAEKLRAYASRLMAFALKAAGDGDTGFAECLETRASECLDQAQAMEEGLAAERELVQSADLLRAALLRVHDSSRDGQEGEAECDDSGLLVCRESQQCSRPKILLKEGGKECGRCIPMNRVSVSECAQCGAAMIAPAWSEHRSDHCVRNVWACETCGYEFEDTVYLPARKLTDAD